MQRHLYVSLVQQILDSATSIFNPPTARPYCYKYYGSPKNHDQPITFLFAGIVDIVILKIEWLSLVQL